MFSAHFWDGKGALGGAVALAAVVVVAAGGRAEAQCCGCTAAAFQAGAATTAAVNAFTAASLAAQTATIWTGLQGTAAQISGNVRATITGQASIAETVSTQDTQRLVQSDRVKAASDYQYSTPLCQTATGAALTAAAAQVSEVNRVVSSANAAHETAGSGSGSAAQSQVASHFAERQGAFCRADDPACKKPGSRPNGDRMPGAILAVGGLHGDEDRRQAEWVARNLTLPVASPALSANQSGGAAGAEVFLRRGGVEAKVNLARDVANEILVDRRAPMISPEYYNQLALAAGLPQIDGSISQVELDRMQQIARFNAAFFQSIGQLDPQTLARDTVGLLATHIQQSHRTNTLLEQNALLLGAVVSLLAEPRLDALRGNVN